jgi:DEAD/DEAH box helicase domain-containing protein
MSIGTALQTLRRNEAFLKDVVAWEVLPPRPARYADAPAELDADLVGLLRQKGVWPLYTHQAQAVQVALARENLVVVTGTASGKTLCYNLPVLQSLRDDPAATALYLFPTKALAQDQLAVLGEWVEDLDGRVRQKLPVNLYDGDTPPGRRPAIRKAGGVVLTNPDMLHIGILPHHTRWARFLANLKIVVLDEIHAYRGVFGSHLANLLRRLRRVCRLYGSDPRFICTSAFTAIGRADHHVCPLSSHDRVAAHLPARSVGARHARGRQSTGLPGRLSAAGEAVD